MSVITLVFLELHRLFSWLWLILVFFYCINIVITRVFLWLHVRGYFCSFMGISVIYIHGYECIKWIILLLYNWSFCAWSLKMKRVRTRIHTSTPLPCRSSSWSLPPPPHRSAGSRPTRQSPLLIMILSQLSQILHQVRNIYLDILTFLSH